MNWSFGFQTTQKKKKKTAISNHRENQTLVTGFEIMEVIPLPINEPFVEKLFTWILFTLDGLNEIKAAKGSELLI